ncbi:MAG TPA: hydantoinase/oxoprolinase family protein, partial [Pseudonocardiaceae bacterium]|nr:hydantoinase/oxoprolinase family protein [Pseudonocardiaceae bacterium]
ALTERAAVALRAEGFAEAEQRFARSADLRYYGQAFEVRVPVPDGPVNRALADATVAAFHDAHERTYGYCFRDRPGQQVEWVNLRVTGIGPIRRPQLRELPAGPKAAPTGTREVSFGGGEARPTPIYQRSALGRGAVVAGPAVSEEYGSTLPLHPGFAAEVDRFGNLVVTRG